MEDYGSLTMHCRDLPRLAPGKPPAEEWECYRREVVLLVAQGYEGRHVLITGSKIMGLFTTREEAMRAGERSGCPGFLVHQVPEYEPLFFHRYLRPNGFPPTSFALPPGNGLFGLRMILTPRGRLRISPTRQHANE